jgi:hypothetical protein
MLMDAAVVANLRELATWRPGRNVEIGVSAAGRSRDAKSDMGEQVETWLSQGLASLNTPTYFTFSPG